MTDDPLGCSPLAIRPQHPGDCCHDLGHWSQVDLSPSSFKCNTHNVDLTAHVEDAVAKQVPVTSFGVGVGRAERQTKKRFRVIVLCPGTVTPHGSPHKLVFGGEVV